jgi:integrase
MSRGLPREVKAHVEKYLAALGTFDRARLAGQDRLSYDVLRHDLEDQREGLRFPDWLVPVNQFFSAPNFFALLASTGLRASEAIHLRLDDLTPDGLVIRCSKFRKSRLVPLHETARAGLERYLQRRRAYAPTEPHLFVSLRRKPLLLHDVEVAFRTAAHAIGLPDTPRARPTPHSLRHTFAVRA